MTQATIPLTIWRGQTLQLAFPLVDPSAAGAPFALEPDDDLTFTLYDASGNAVIHMSRLVDGLSDVETGDGVTRLNLDVPSSETLPLKRGRSYSHEIWFVRGAVRLPIAEGPVVVRGLMPDA